MNITSPIDTTPPDRFRVCEGLFARENARKAIDAQRAESELYARAARRSVEVA